jgi:cytochrome oxidase Cu insertion factor (SCO1/SenC/PrrC family)
VKGGLTVLRGINRTRRATWLAVAGLAAAVALAGCSSASSQPPRSANSPASSAAEQNPNLDLGSSLGNEKAPDFTLTNQFGQQMSLSQFRGKVVVLSFMDAECTDVCPLESASMVLAKELLGKAGDSVQLLSVDANPIANKVADVMSYSRAHSMVNQWDYLTGSDSQLEAVWKNYNIEVQVVDGDIDHTPAVYVINSQGDLEKIYLTQMAYSSVTQSAQVIASEVAGLLPSHPKLSSIESLAALPTQTPADTVSLPAATTAGPVTLGPGKARLVAFFATWLTETSDLKDELASLNGYVKDAAAHGLPPLTTVDETVTETSKQAVTSFLGTVGPLNYPVGLDETGRLADGYGVQDQPWLVLVNAAGKITWQHDGWLPVSAIERAAG